MLIDKFSIGPTLKFNDENIENQFLHDVVFGNLFAPRLIYLGGAFLYAIFFILDWFLMQDQLLLSVFIRFFVVCPMLFTTYFLIGTSFYKKYWLTLILINGFSAGGGLLLLMSQSPPPGNHLYYGGLLLCCLFYYVFQPRQVVSNILSWGVFFLYFIVAIFFTETPGAIFLNNIFIFFFFNIGGMFACYSMELFQRKEFAHKLMMQDQSDRLYHALSEVEHQREKAQQLSLQDPLTGLPNRRHFFDVLAKQLESSYKAGQDLSLILLDVDDFKKVNDHLGHVAGDQVLALVAEIIADTVRKGDTPCRYGGEEFAILLPNSSSQVAEKIGRKIMEYIEGGYIPVGQGEECLTVSAGLATLSSGQQSSVENFIELADQALYLAKNCGKKQLRMWTRDLQGYGV